MSSILKTYLKRLTNLSNSNKSLLQYKLYKAQDIDIKDFDFLLHRPSFTIIEQLLTGKSKIELCAVEDSRDSNTSESSLRLKGIQRKKNFIFDERGAQDLYVGWPYINGKFQDGTPVRCPFLFFPVDLQISNGKWWLIPRKDVSITFNKSFLLAYGHFNQTKVSEELLERSFERTHESAQDFINDLYEYIKDSILELNFNRSLFSEQLTTFKQYTKTEFQDDFQNGNLKLEPQAVIGLFPQAGSYLVPDYEFMESNAPIDSFENFFTKKTTTQFPHVSSERFSYKYLNQTKEEQTFTSFPIDASQENALKAVKAGNSMVIQGPPGTGKSQLICNLISDYTARGKKVLVVCQKKAALDVVYNRLKEVKLTPFVALVHDFKSDRKDIYQQIELQIKSLEDYEQQNAGLDTIYLERDYLDVSRNIDRITEELDEFKAALFDTTECGISVKELYLSCDLSSSHIGLNQEYRHFDREKITSFVSTLQDIYPYILLFEKKDHPWKERKSFAHLTIQDLQVITNILEQIPNKENEFKKKIREILHDPFSINDSEWILDRKETIQNIITLLDDDKIYAYFKHMINKTIDLDWFFIHEKSILECFKEPGIEMSIPFQELKSYIQIIEQANKAKSNALTWLKFSLFNKNKYKLKRIIVKNNLTWDKKGFKTLSNMIDNRLNLEHNITEILQKNWLIDFPSEYDHESLRSWFDHQSVALEALQLSQDLRSFRDYLKIENIPYVSLKAKLNLVLNECSKVHELKKSWRKYLTPVQIEKILQNHELITPLLSSVKNDFDLLCEYDKMNASLLQIEKDVLKKIMNTAEITSVDTAESIFKHSIYASWINHIEGKYPCLRIVSSPKIEKTERDLQKNIKAKQKFSQDILQLKIKEQTYRGVEYNRLGNRTTYRELLHQVTKKRKIWPLRKTIAEFHQELFQLIPCWLSSPESVSALFPMEEIFDLIIFDEASQCYAEKGLPGIYRAKQVVITGDDQQLSPNDLYQVRWEEEDDDVSHELEIDSLLDLAKQHLPEVMLTGHYRSESLDLIRFSNEHFYQNKLKLLPSYQTFLNPKKAISYENVQGTWSKSTNEKEALHITELVINYLMEGMYNIGIVTFNYKQKDLIQDLLENEVINRGIFLPTELFVKNIENVQGDERDIIIFSIGYAYDSRNRFHMQFGSLNMEGGENRLNVAVSRARKKIHLITSILPQDLKVDETKHKGPKLLKKYLEYAYQISNSNLESQELTTSNIKQLPYLKQNLSFLLASNTKTDYSIDHKLPFADAAILKNKNYHLLLLTDDDLYHQSISVKESHAYHPLTLKSKDWKFTKLYSRNFWLDKNKLKTHLHNQLT